MSHSHQQQQVYDFLTAFRVADPDRVINSLSRFHQLLQEYNPQVNLISRKTPPEHVWLYHFLDSLLALKCLDFEKQMILDFGSGGGLPGIPIRLACPQVRMFLLEAIRKKCLILRQMLDRLNIKDCRVINQRLENYALSAESPRFDYIICRAVAMEERYLPPLRQLLRRNGKVIFYKAHRLDDIANLRYQTLLEEDVPGLGFRRILALDRNDLVGSLSKATNNLNTERI
ncbi:MAG: 16S rRNA (guanine(527)-N(7))-methyltransferase RsmG [Candidatus Cloacimonetes bacterium]|nr:16S rRNA (guanine(527)-N(7))-methyltransferase RsmG [Candidatus Cloacimonadota bacterium]